MPTTVTVDVAGGVTGGAARFRTEFYNYMRYSPRRDVHVIGDRQRLSPSWLLRREVASTPRTKRIALNNVGFVAPGGERWTLLRNALHFLSDEEKQELEPSLMTAIGRQTTIVRLAARRSDVLVVPCSSMAERVLCVIPSLRSRLVVRPHPVSADSIPTGHREPAILCPVIFESYKRMRDRVSELLAAMDRCCHPSVRLRVTADPDELHTGLANHPRVESLGRLSYKEVRIIWGRSKAIFFPTGLESFGYPLAESRVSGHPVIGLDTPQNREIAGPALFGFSTGDPSSLCDAVTRALSADVKPDPMPFDPDAYFHWLLAS